MDPGSKQIRIRIHQIRESFIADRCGLLRSCGDSHHCCPLLYPPRGCPHVRVQKTCGRYSGNSVFCRTRVVLYRIVTSVLTFQMKPSLTYKRLATIEKSLGLYLNGGARARAQMSRSVACTIFLYELHAMIVNTGE